MTQVMPDVAHEPNYRKLAGVYKARVTKFIKCYPNYCRACNAYGQEWYYDFEGFYTDHNCPYCIEKDLCPRCMTPTLIEKHDNSEQCYEYMTCSTCGWRGDDDWGDKYSYPHDVICICKKGE